jgi:fibrillarin-like pre-rRNA processing protein
MAAMKEVFPGVFKEDNELFTINTVPGEKVYGEKLVKGNFEYREWNPRRSKLAAAIMKGLRNMPIGNGTRVLYLGSSTGTTVSHISDIIGNGSVYSVEFAERVFREFISLAEKRKNIVPILADARRINDYSWIEECTVVFCDLAQSDETEILLRNAKEFLGENGWLLLSVKSQSIDVTKKPELVYKQEAEKISNAGFRVIETINLEPFEEKHAMIVARK